MYLDYFCRPSKGKPNKTSDCQKGKLNKTTYIISWFLMEMCYIAKTKIERQKWKFAYFSLLAYFFKIQTPSFFFKIDGNGGLKIFTRKGGVRQNGRSCLKWAIAILYWGFSWDSLWCSIGRKPWCVYLSFVKLLK